MTRGRYGLFEDDGRMTPTPEESRAKVYEALTTRLAAVTQERDDLSTRAWAYESQIDDERRWRAEAEARLGRLVTALREAERLVQTWDDSADSLGPEWLGMSDKVDALRVALAAAAE